MRCVFLFVIDVLVILFLFSSSKVFRVRGSLSDCNPRMASTPIKGVRLRMCSLLLITLTAGSLAMGACLGIRCETGCSTLPCFQTWILFESLLECPLIIFPWQR
jgi:hypothetical protein